jgi:hypothetical protein
MKANSYYLNADFLVFFIKLANFSMEIFRSLYWALDLQEMCAGMASESASPSGGNVDCYGTVKNYLILISSFMYTGNQNFYSRDLVDHMTLSLHKATC